MRHGGLGFFLLLSYLFYTFAISEAAMRKKKSFVQCTVSQLFHFIVRDFNYKTITHYQSSKKNKYFLNMGTSKSVHGLWRLETRIKKIKICLHVSYNHVFKNRGQVEQVRFLTFLRRCI
jgi:hypothetical protein